MSATPTDSENNRMLSGTCGCGAGPLSGRGRIPVRDELSLLALSGCDRPPVRGDRRHRAGQARSHGRAGRLLVVEPELNDTRCGVCGSLLFSVVRDGAYVHVAMGSLVDAPKHSADAPHLRRLQGTMVRDHRRLAAVRGARDLVDTADSYVISITKRTAVSVAGRVAVVLDDEVEALADGDLSPSARRSRPPRRHDPGAGRFSAVVERPADAVCRSRAGALPFDRHRRFDPDVAASGLRQPTIAFCPGLAGPGCMNVCPLLKPAAALRKSVGAARPPSSGP